MPEQPADVTRRRMLQAGLCAAMAAPFLAWPAHAAEPAVYVASGYAIGGTDPVAYHRQGAAIAGESRIAHDWQGATWLFATAQSRDLFAADPERYAPAFGGYCAWAVSRGYLASTVPEAWTLFENRLFLNFSLRVQRRWAQDIPGNVARGDAQWPQVLG